MDLFLAGAESHPHYAVLRGVRYPFRLASYIYLKEPHREAVLDAARDGSSWIMDSGVFTLILGAQRGTIKTVEQARTYADRYAADLAAWGWSHEIVEMDIQGAFGLDAVWTLRREIFAQLGDRVMYVWHPKDGEAELRRLAQHTARIGFSVPEATSLFAGGTGATARARLRNFFGKAIAVARQENPGVRPHLLGCTTFGMMTIPGVASCDSSSWFSGTKYGQGSIIENGRSRQVTYYSPRYQAWAEYVAERDSERLEAARAYLAAVVPNRADWLDRWTLEAITYERIMEAVNARA